MKLHVWILIFVGIFSSFSYSQKYTCLVPRRGLGIGYSENEFESEFSEQELPENERRSYNRRRQEDDEDDDNDETDDQDDKETNYRNRYDADEDDEKEDDEHDDRKKRQVSAPDLTLPTQLIIGSLNESSFLNSSLVPDDIVVPLSGQTHGVNIGGQRFHDDVESLFKKPDDYYDDRDPKSGTSVDDDGSTTSSIKGEVRCQNPSQKLYFRRVTLGYSDYGSCFNARSNCSKDISHHIQVLRCFGNYGPCHFDIKTELLLGCGRMNNYIKIEYDCVFDHSLFDVCATVDVSRWNRVTITSPSYPLSPKGLSTGVRTCECEISTDLRSSISLSHFRSDLAGSDDKCDEEIVLLEQKYNAKQTSKFQVTDELCGEKLDYNRRFGDSVIRLTYLIGGVDNLKEQGGFFAQMKADSFRAESSLLNIKCNQPERNDSVGIVNTGRRSNVFPVVVKERTDIKPPMRVPGIVMALPATAPPLRGATDTQAYPTSPRWRVGPRGRKYIPRPGHPDGPLFLDGGGLNGFRRRYPSGRRPQQNLRRRILPRTTTTISPIADNQTVSVVSYVFTTTSLPAVSLPALGSANVAGAVMGGAQSATNENAKIHKSAEGTLIAVVASMASIIAIMVSVGFYYFFRKYQRKSNAIGSDMSSSWYSGSYYGDSRLFSRRTTENENQRRTDEQTSSRGGKPRNHVESVYYEAGDNNVITHHVPRPDPNHAGSAIKVDAPQTSPNSQNASVLTVSSAETNKTPPEFSPVTTIQAPPRRKRRRQPPIPPVNHDYDNNATVVIEQSQANMGSAGIQGDTDSNQAVLEEHSKLNDTRGDSYVEPPCGLSDAYENESIIKINTRDLNATTAFARYENTEYASIPEMQEMANSEC